MGWRACLRTGVRAGWDGMEKYVLGRFGHCDCEEEEGGLRGEG